MRACRVAAYCARATENLLQGKARGQVMTHRVFDQSSETLVRRTEVAFLTTRPVLAQTSKLRAFDRLLRTLRIASCQEEEVQTSVPHKDCGSLGFAAAAVGMRVAQLHCPGTKKRQRHPVRRTEWMSSRQSDLPCRRRVDVV